MRIWGWSRKSDEDDDVVDEYDEKLDKLLEEMKALKKHLVEIEKTYDKYVLENQKRTGILESQLQQKVHFIEKLFAGVIDKALSNGSNGNGHDTAAANGKAGDNNLVDISKFSDTAKSYVQAQIKKASEQKK